MSMLHVLLGALGAQAAGSVGTVKYFGYWCPDEPPQMAGFTNIGFAKDVTLALANKAAGISTLFSLRHIFLNKTVHSDHPGHSVNTLRNDYQALWAAAVPTFKALLANETIIGFFLGDELLWNGGTPTPTPIPAPTSTPTPNPTTTSSPTLAPRAHSRSRPHPHPHPRPHFHPQGCRSA